MHRQIVTALVAAASPLALTAIEIRCVLAFRDKYARAVRLRSKDSRRRAAARITHGSFMGGGVPFVREPCAQRCISPGRGHDCRHVLCVKIVADATAIPR